VALSVGALNVRGEAARPSSPDIRRQISAALNNAFPDSPAARQAQAQEFLKLYAAAAEMPSPDRARFQRRLKSRLARLANAIHNDGIEQARPSSDDPESGSVASPGVKASPRAAELPGGGSQDDGQALVELIQATIAPQSWDVNGGPGTIKYWPAWHVLVVRQTDDVHEQIGGTVHGLRK
jgi:hypothetical protein